MSQSDWKAEYAYAAGMQAFTCGFPYVYSARRRDDWVTRARDPAVFPYAAVNCFWHAERLLGAANRDGGCPDNDTLYSLAWLDLGGSRPEGTRNLRSRLDQRGLPPAAVIPAGPAPGAGNGIWAVGPSGQVVG